MKRTIAALCSLTLILLTTVACDRQRGPAAYEELHGTWETTMEMPELGVGDEEPLADDQVEQTIPLPDEVSRQLMNIPLRQTFAPDGGFTLEVGARSYEGTWDVAEREGDRLYVIVRIDQGDERPEQRLVELVEFIDDDTISIGDEQGNAREFDRAAR